LKELASRIKNIRRPLHREIRDYAVRLGFKDLIFLNVGEPDFPTPRPIAESGKQAIDSGFTHYTEERGIKSLREALAEKIRKEKKVELDPTGEILVTSGSSEAILASILCLANPGDEVLIFDPYYPPYISSVYLASAKPVLVPVDGETLKPIPELVAEKVSEKTKLIIINSPCNPTGAVYDRKILEAIAEIVLTHDLYVISDEVYERFVFENAEHFSIASLPEMAERTLIINSFSKTYAMTGWRIGYVAGPAEIINNVLKVRGAGNVCASSIAQRAAIVALEKCESYVDEMVKEYDRRRKIVCNGLKKIKGFKTSSPQGAFYVFPDISNIEKDSVKFTKFLVENAHVVVSPGVGFGPSGEGRIRISYSIKAEKLEEALERIRVAVEEYR
jgi:aminotransferase